MAFASDIRAVETGFQSRLLAAYHGLAERVARYKTYRETMNELSQLSSRDLADLGLHRSMIKSVALEAAYGA